MINTQETSQRQKAEQELADWIKPDIIAEIIFEELESAGIDPTLENAQKIYLDLLENTFYEAVKHCIEYCPAFSGQSGFAPVATPQPDCPNDCPKDYFDELELQRRLGK